jgi:hypothetical protein
MVPILKVQLKFALPILDVDEPGGIQNLRRSVVSFAAEGKVFLKTNAELLIHNTMLIFLARIN